MYNSSVLNYYVGENGLKWAMALICFLKRTKAIRFWE